MKMFSYKSVFRYKGNSHARDSMWLTIMGIIIIGSIVGLLIAKRLVQSSV